MRFNNRITFVTETDSYYDPSIGDYVEGKLVKEVKPCNLSPIKIERQKELFGEFDETLTVARLQRPHKKEFDYVEIKNHKYNVKHRSDYRKGVFYLERDSFGD